MLGDDDVAGVGLKASAEPGEGSIGQVEALGFLGRLDEGAPVVDAYDQRPAVGDIGDLDTGAERQLRLAAERSRSGVRVVVEELAAGGTDATSTTTAETYNAN